MSIKTNVFIVGAQKCGTTTLANYLRKHSKVELIARKEPHIFSKFYPGSELIDHEVVKLYKKNEKSVFIDASTTYSFSSASEKIAKRIHKYNPKAKIIFLVKDPIERIISHYNHRVRRNREVKEINLDILSNQSYIENSQYYSSIMPYINVFGQQRVYILTFSDLLKKTEKITKQIEAFLGLNPELDNILPNSNRNLQESLVRAQYGPFRKRYLRIFPERVQVFIRDRFFRKSISEKSIPTDQTIKILREILADDMQKFYELTGIDFR